MGPSKSVLRHPFLQPAASGGGSEPSGEEQPSASAGCGLAPLKAAKTAIRTKAIQINK